MRLVAALCFLSSSVFNRPLDIDAHHEYLTAHSLVSLRALDQWGIGNLLGASVLVPKSMEYLQADITIFDPKTITDNSGFKVGQHGIPTTGIPYVIVNGITVVKNNEVLTVKPGKEIRFPI